MLSSFEDTYADYLVGLLSHLDVDVDIVIETLNLLGIDNKEINDLIGETFHVCPKSPSSDSSSFQRSELNFYLTKESNKGYLNNFSEQKNSPLIQEFKVPYEEVCEEKEKKPQCNYFSESASSVTESECSQMHPHTKEFSQCRYNILNYEHNKEKPYQNQNKVWNDTILTPERRHRYKVHLSALEKLLGVVWNPTKTSKTNNSDNRNINNSDESVPLEIRSFLCRQRIEKWLLHGENMRKFPVSQPFQGQKEKSDRIILMQQQQEQQQQKEKEIQKNIQTRRMINNEIIPRCNRHHMIRITNNIGIQRQCEFCASLEDKFLSSFGVEHVMQPQITPSATGKACGVKMRPRVVNTVGCGRIKTKALATTLPQREDRVRKALAYRDEWNSVNYFAKTR